MSAFDVAAVVLLILVALWRQAAPRWWRLSCGVIGLWWFWTAGWTGPFAAALITVLVANIAWAWEFES